MNTTIENLQNELQNLGSDYFTAFVRFAGAGDLSVEDFRQQIDAELPEVFYEFYAWAQTSAQQLSPDQPVTEIADDGPFLPNNLALILADTLDWRKIKAEQPDREWQDGFVSVQNWGSAYTMVVDTLGKVSGRKGQIVYYDFKGGGSYWVAYDSYEEYLQAICNEIKTKSYFPNDLNPDIKEILDDTEDFEYETVSDFWQEELHSHVTAETTVAWPN